MWRPGLEEVAEACHRVARGPRATAERARQRGSTPPQQQLDLVLPSHHTGEGERKGWGPSQKVQLEDTHGRPPPRRALCSSACRPCSVHAQPREEVRVPVFCRPGGGSGGPLQGWEHPPRRAGGGQGHLSHVSPGDLSSGSPGFQAKVGPDLEPHPGSLTPSQEASGHGRGRGTEATGFLYQWGRTDGLMTGLKLGLVWGSAILGKSFLYFGPDCPSVKAITKPVAGLSWGVKVHVPDRSNPQL